MEGKRAVREMFFHFVPVRALATRNNEVRRILLHLSGAMKLEKLDIRSLQVKN